MTKGDMINKYTNLFINYYHFISRMSVEYNLDGQITGIFLSGEQKIATCNEIDVKLDSSGENDFI
jgi:hypothetical protein